MERSRAVSEASSSRGAPAYDYASLPEYRSSLPYYNPQASFDTRPINRDGYGGYYTGKIAPDPAGDGLSGNYSYASSYDDLSRRYGYGSGGGSNLSEACKGVTFDGTSDYRHEPSYRSITSPHTSGFSQDVGPTFGSRHHAFAEEKWISNRYDDDLGSRKSILDSGIKPDVLSYERSSVDGQGKLDYDPLKDYNILSEQSISRYYAPTAGNPTDAIRDEKSNYLLASKYDATPSGLYLPSSALYDWRSAGGIQRAPEELGWKAFSGLSSIACEQGTLDRAGNSSRFMDRSSYLDPKEYSKFGLWDVPAGRKAELDLGGKVNTPLSMLHSEAIANGSKKVEASIPVQDVGMQKPVDEGKKRQSRWEPVEENEKNGEDKKQKKKTRWSAEKSPVKEVSLTNIMKVIPAEGADIFALRARLIVINTMLQSGHVLDSRNTERSPSPEPIFDNFGFRINTREFRAREKLNKERQKIVARLSENLVPSKPAGGKPSKLSKKIYIPVDKYPGYNFIGLIIGPRGNTQKKLEKECGAKIFIRGKGSVKEGVHSAYAILSENEDLHVLIEADSEDSIKKASEMVEKLLIPVEDGQNELKRAQLRELASMNGTLRGHDVSRECKESGDIAKECPGLGLAAVSGIAEAQKGEAAPDNDICQVCKGSGPKHLRKEYPMLCSGSNSLKGGSKGGDNVAADVSIDAENDNTHLYVAYLPSSVDDAQLLSLFSPFGRMEYAEVMKHHNTGLSKCYGFVKFFNAADAAAWQDRCVFLTCALYTTSELLPKPA